MWFVKLYVIGAPSDQGRKTMSSQTSFLRRDPAEVEPWAETCGAIRCLIEEADGAAGEVHHGLGRYGDGGADDRCVRQCRSE